MGLHVCLSVCPAESCISRTDCEVTAPPSRQLQVNQNTTMDAAEHLQRSLVVTGDALLTRPTSCGR